MARESYVLTRESGVPLLRALRGLFVALGATLACGCVRTVNDVIVSSIAITDAYEWTIHPLRNGSMLRVDVTSNTDLARLLRGTGALPIVHSFFCDRPGDYAVLGGAIYATARNGADAPIPLWRVASEPSQNPPLSTAFTYHVILNLARPASPLSNPPQIAFDLAANPEDICI